MKVLITGATGYIGERLVQAALARKFDVVSLSRRPSRHSGVAWIPYDLFDHVAPNFPNGTDAVIHLAAGTASTHNIEDYDELRAAQLLLAAAKKSNIKFIFVSSQTARHDAPTAYGRMKWRIEQDVLASKGWVIRPGQVYGGAEHALFGTLVAAVRRLPVLPAFLPSPKVQPIHVDDLAGALLNIVERNDITPSLFQLASQDPISFTYFLSVIASVRIRHARWFFPVPVVFVKIVGRILGKRLRAGLGLDRLSSLFNLPTMDCWHDLQRLGIVLRPLRSGMHRSGDDRRRSVIEEGRCLLTYLLKEVPDSDLLRRYVRAVEHLRGGHALNLPKVVRMKPILLSLLDDRSVVASIFGAEFAWRLDAATILAEATRQGVDRFLGKQTGIVTSTMNISHAVFAEVMWRILRFACTPFVRRAIHYINRES